MRAAALAAWDAGLCVVKVKTDGTKWPVSIEGAGRVDPKTGEIKAGWKKFQRERPTRDAVAGWFADGHPGIGVVCGPVSGNLEMLELEGAAVADGFADRLADAVKLAGLDELFARILNGYSESTPRNGIHWLLRVTDGEPLGNVKLAVRPRTDAERAADPANADKPVTLAETRGTGGFAVVAPSHGPVHPNRQPWRLERGGFGTIADVTVAERDALYNVVRSLSEIDTTPGKRTPTPPAVEPGKRTKVQAWTGGTVGTSWIDAVVAHLEATTSVRQVLERHGWSHVYDVGQVAYMKHPTASNAVSAIVNEKGRLLVYSTSTSFEHYGATAGATRTYDVLDVIAEYEHAGNREGAARAIADATGIYAAWLAERDIQWQAEHEAFAAEQGVTARPASSRPEPVAVRVIDPDTWQPDTVIERQVLAGPDGYRYSDVGNGQRLIARHGEHLRFVDLWERWLVYANGRWQLDHAETMVRYLAGRIGAELLTREHFDRVNAEPDHERRKEKRAALVRWATKSESRYGMLSTVTAAATVPGVAVDHEALDADGWLLNVRNGTLELRTGVLRPHDPNDLLTMQAAVSFDPTADAPRFRAFLEQVLPDAELRRFVARLFGVVLIGEQVEHLLPVGIGSGGNGKSVLTRIVAEVLGDYSVVASTDLLLAVKQDQHPTMKASLFRRRFAHSGELPPGAQLDEAQVKRLTGGDLIEARRMRENPWEFKPSHTLWVHANHRPAITGADDGIWRRVLLIPFDIQVPADQQDPNLANRIIADEGPGVLRWMLDGLADYLAVGLNPPDRVKAATSSYRQASDTATTFLTDVGARFDPSEWTLANDVMAAHGEWFRTAGVVGHGTEASHYQQVVAEMKRRGATNGRSRTKGGSFWQGVTFDAA